MPRSVGPQETEFSTYIRQRRQQLAISLPELQRRTGIHSSRLSRWERGIEEPDRPERLSALADGLEVPPADLFILGRVPIIDQLPSHTLFLRCIYGPTVPREVLGEITAYADRAVAASRHGRDSSGSA